MSLVLTTTLIIIFHTLLSHFTLCLIHYLDSCKRIYLIFMDMDGWILPAVLMIRHCGSQRGETESSKCLSNCRHRWNSTWEGESNIVFWLHTPRQTFCYSIRRKFMFMKLGALHYWIKWIWCNVTEIIWVIRNKELHIGNHIPDKAKCLSQLKIH